MVMENEFVGVEFRVPSVNGIVRSMPGFRERAPELKVVRPGGLRGSSLVKKVASNANEMAYGYKVESLPDIDRRGGASPGFSHQERAWRDLEKTVIGNQVKWTCTVPPATRAKRRSEMSMHCPSESHTVELRGGNASALDSMSDSPTSTVTVETDRNNVSVAMSDHHRVHAFDSSTLQLPVMDRNLLDVTGSLGSDGYSSFDLELSSPFPIISSEFDVAEDCNSCGSGESEHHHQRPSATNLATFDGIPLQDCGGGPLPEPCEILDSLPSLFGDPMCYNLAGMHNVDGDIDRHMCAVSDVLVGAVDEGLSNDTAREKEERGVELVQQLLACAQAVAEGEVAAVQQHVKRLSHLMSPTGSSMERVATYFTKALSAWLSGEHRGHEGCHDDHASLEPAAVEQSLMAYQAFYTSSPYLIVTHFTANQAILEAFEGEEKVHVVDLDIKQGLQWPSLIQALSERPMGPPRLRITGVAGASLDMKSLIATKKRLLDFADMFNVPLEVTVITERVENLQPWTLGIRDNEALAVNCVSSLHQLIGPPRVSIDGFLQMIHSLEPSVVTIVEQDANHDQEFLPRFVNALHYYSSMFDSLAASCLSSNQAEREMVEQLLLGKDIMNIVGREGQGRFARHQTAEVWIRRMTDVGFRLLPLSSRSILQAKCLLGMFPVSKYCLLSEECYLSLGWQDKPLYCVSSWC